MGFNLNPGKPIEIKPLPGDFVRFLLKVRVGGEPDIPGWKLGPCWNWIGAYQKDERGSNRYGKFWFDGGPKRANRVSYHFFRGDLTDGDDVDHLCHNTQCVCPWHIELENVSVNRSRQAPPSEPEPELPEQPADDVPF